MKLNAVLLIAIVSLTGISLSAEENILYRQSFDPPPQGVSEMEGVRGKAGHFNGVDQGIPIGSFGFCDRLEIDFDLKAERIEQNAGWESLITTGDWQSGSIRFCLRNGKFVMILHRGGDNRTHLESPPLENGRWYHLHVLIDTESEAIVLSIDQKEVARVAFASGVEMLALNNVAIGTETPRQVFDEKTKSFTASEKKRCFQGALDELTISGNRTDPIVYLKDDPRNIVNGHEIPDETYCDQPYIVVMRDGTWVCTLTTAPGGESSLGQHVVATSSTDQGKTWSPVVDIEPSAGPYASWVVPYLTPYGRIYAMYTFNGDNLSFSGGKQPWFDSTHGWFAYRYSDDSGKTWSERYRIPIRRTACDTAVIDGQIVQMFWSVSKAEGVGDEMFLSYTKLGKHFLEEGDGWIVHSNNIGTEKDPGKIHWELLPEGMHGIRNPDFGSIQEEHISTSLNEKDAFCCVYRTTRGFPAVSYSRDACKSWSLPEPMRYATGRIIRTPRACPMIRKCSNGKYVFWFHNNGSPSFQNRNPAWVSGGVERDGKIFWSQPEILLYIDSTPSYSNGMSYPDLFEADGKYWISETEKEIGRVHEIDPSLLEGMWSTLERQIDGKSANLVEKGLALETSEHHVAFPPQCADLQHNRGITLDFVVDGTGLKEGEILFDNRDEHARGLSVVVGKDGAVALTMKNKGPGSKAGIRCESDPGFVGDGVLPFTVIVDAAPRIISFVGNGQFGDGAAQRTHGWTRFKLIPSDVSGSGTITLAPAVKKFRIYNRYLRVNEAVDNHLSTAR